MAGALIEVTVKDEAVKALLNSLAARIGNLTPAMKIIGETVRTSVVKNFEDEGRPVKWAPLKPSTLARKKSTAILRDQGFAGGLLGSIHATAFSDRVTVGTNKIYGAVHQFGAKKGSFGSVAVARKLGTAGRSGATLFTRGWNMAVPWGDIPARPYLMVQDEDWTEIDAALTDYITTGRTA